MKLFLKQHWIGLTLSIVIGIIIAAPPVLFQLSDDYAGFPMMKTNTETHYTTQVREVYDGHYNLGNPFFEDLKDEPYLFPPLGPHLYAWLGKLFGLNPVSAIMSLRFVFTSAMAFFIYLFASALSRNKLVGYVSAPFIMLGYSLVDPGHIATLFREGGIPEHVGFIDYGRPVNPQVSSLFFFSYLYCFWRALHDPIERWKRFGVASAVILGLSFYVYLYTWTFIFTLNGFLFLVYASKKEWSISRRIALVSAGAAGLAIPYILHTLEVLRHPWYAESASRFGFVRMREWQVSRLLLGLLVPFLLAYRRFSEPARRFFVAFFLTAFFVENEQVLTGRYFFNHHFHWYYVTPLTIVLIVMIIHAFLPSLFRRQQLERSLAVVWVAVLVLYGILTQKTAYTLVLPEVIADQRYAPVVAWLNKETPKDSTVVASLAFSDAVPPLTHNNVYLPNTGFYTLVPDERLLHTYLTDTFLLGISRENIRSYLETHRNELSGFAFGYTYSFLPGICYGCFPDSLLDGMAQNYQRITDESFVGVLKEYPADYLVWDRARQPTWAIDRFGLSEVVRFGDISIYAL